MREFEQAEKDILAKMASDSGSNLFELLAPWLKGVQLTVDTHNNSVEIAFDNRTVLPQTENKRLKDIQRAILQTVNLIKLFEDKGFIFTYLALGERPSNPFTYGPVILSQEVKPRKLNDPRISTLFCDYSSKEIYATPELIKFVKDGFLSREELRANRQWKTTMIALVTAIIALFVNIFFNIF